MVINSHTLVASTARFVARTPEEEACRTEGVYEKEEKVAEIQPIPVSAEPFYSELPVLFKVYNENI